MSATQKLHALESLLNDKLGAFAKNFTDDHKKALVKHGYWTEAVLSVAGVDTLVKYCDLPAGYAELLHAKLFKGATAGGAASSSVPPGSGAEPSTSEALTTLTKAVHAVHVAVMERLSATVPASKIKQTELENLVKLMQAAVQFTTDDGDIELRKLMTTAVRGDVWDDTPEPQQRDMYRKVIQEMAPCSTRSQEWRDATASCVKRMFGSMHAPVAAKNDEVLVVRRISTFTIATGALIGIELKKELSYRAIRQALAEFLLWSDASFFPFVQLVTDMQRGGVAFYYTGEILPGGIRIIAQHVLVGMEAVWTFLRKAIKKLPANIASKRLDGTIVWPLELPSPKRMKLDIPPGKASAIQDPHSLLAALLNNEDDIACMRDVMGDLKIFHGSPAPSSSNIPDFMYT